MVARGRLKIAPTDSDELRPTLSFRVERSGIEGSWHPVTLCTPAHAKILRLALLAQDDTQLP